MANVGSQIISSGMQHVRESLVRVQRLVIKIHPLHLQQLQTDEAAYKEQIQKMKSHPQYIEDEFARRTDSGDNEPATLIGHDPRV